jgi:hypothetical protein
VTGSAFPGELAGDVERGDYAFRGAGPGRDDRYAAFELQETIAVRRAVTVEAQEAAVGRGRCRASERS